MTPSSWIEIGFCFLVEAVFERVNEMTVLVITFTIGDFNMFNGGKIVMSEYKIIYSR